jgi:hypothetical protein
MEATARPWYREGHQQLWLLAVVAATALGGSMFLFWRNGLASRAELQTWSAAIGEDNALNARLSTDLAGYDELINRGTADRDQLVREVSDFKNQLKLLKSRTDRLELVKTDLEKLDQQFAGYRRAEDAFKVDLRRLEGRPEAHRQ